MTGNSFVLDTSAVIEFFEGNSNVVNLLKAETIVKIPATVLGELYLGIYRSSNPEKHSIQVNQFIASCDIVLIDLETAKVYATIKNKLFKKGKPIPENDIWIAAVAIRYELPLVAFDKHFLEIEGLKLEELK